MAALLSDDRVPGVSNALRSRVARLVGAGVTPSLRGNRVVLGDVTLVFANGREAPAAGEMRRHVASRNLDAADYAVNRFQPNTLTRSNGRLVGLDRNGREHVLLRHFRGVTRVTPAGRRYEAEAPLVSWVVRIPVVHRRNNGLPFDAREVTLTDDDLRRMAPGGADVFQLRGRVTAANAQRLLDFVRGWADVSALSQFKGSQYADDRNVNLVLDDSREISLDHEEIVDGQPTAFLDQVVRGEPVLAWDMWQKARLHPASRRRNGECGIDVIVASQLRRCGDNTKKRNQRLEPVLDAQQVACQLVQLAREHFPQSALANHTQWDNVEDGASQDEMWVVSAELRSHGLLKSCDFKSELGPYVPMMMRFLGRKVKLVDVIMRAWTKGNIYRTPFEQLPRVSLHAFLRDRLCFLTSDRQRLLAFLRVRSEFVAVPTESGLSFACRGSATDETDETAAISPDAAREAIREHGTPLELLKLFYERTRVRLVLFQGRTCRAVFTPPGWEAKKGECNTVVLNIWKEHAFCYQRDVGDVPFVAKDATTVPEVALKPYTERDRVRFCDMKPLCMASLKANYDAKREATYYTTHGLDNSFFSSLEEHGDISFTPLWSSIDHCSGVTISLSKKKRIRIRSVPEDYELLAAFAEQVQKTCGLRLDYEGESAGVLGSRLIQELMVRRRQNIGDCAEQLASQKGRCNRCGDRIESRFEKNHIIPLREGGSNDASNIELLCCPCHADVTERQELSAGRGGVWLESRLSPTLLKLFQETPMPRQEVWGHASAIRAQEQGSVRCLDICGCRSNVLLERMRDLPIYCPIDECERIFDVRGHYNCALTEFEWIWVDIFEQAESDVGWREHTGNRLYDGPHLYPLDTVLFLIEDGFLEPSAETMPFGCRPSHRRPARDLHDAIRKMGDCWSDLSDKISLIPGVYTPELACKQSFKGMLLSMIGVWSIQKQERLTAVNSTVDADMPRGRFRIKRISETQEMSFLSTRLVCNKTMLPLVMQCRFGEALRMEKAARIMASLPNIKMLGARVDALYWATDDEASAEQLELLVSRERYPLTGGPVYQFKPPDAQLPLNAPLEHGDAYSDCFRPDMDHPPLTAWRETEDEAELDEVFGPRGQQLWAEEEVLTFTEKAVRLIYRNEGGYVSGLPGTGKSNCILRPLVELLKAKGEEVYVCAYTHAAARLVGGVTIAYLLHRRASLIGCWLVIDECSIIPIDVLGQLARLRNIGARFVFLGDFQGQHLAMKDRWHRVPYERVPHSECLRTMVNDLWIHLGVNRRSAKNPRLFDWFSALYDRPEHEVQLMVDEARSQFPIGDLEPHQFYTILCISHKKRKFLNARQNELLAMRRENSGLRTDYYHWDKPPPKGCTCEPQAMVLWEGIELIGCPRGSGKPKCGIVQGVLYRVTRLLDDGVEVTMHERYRRAVPAAPEDDEEEEDEEDPRRDDSKPVKIASEDVPLLLRLTHAVCYFTVQGRTIEDEHILLLDTGHPHFTKRSLIVGASRATHHKYVHVATEEQENAWLGQTRRKVKARRT
jgi:hypothetical protein